MINPRSARATLEGRVEDEREHLLEHAAGAETAQLLQQRGNLPQPVARAGGARREREGVAIVQKDQLRAAGAYEADFVAGVQLALGDRFAVDEGAVRRPDVAAPQLVRLQHDLGMSAGHLGVAEAQTAGIASADRKRAPIDRDDVVNQRVTNPKAWHPHRRGLNSRTDRAWSQ